MIKMGLMVSRGITPYTPSIAVGFRTTSELILQELDDIIRVIITEPYRFLRASSHEAGKAAYGRGQPVNFPEGGLQVSVFAGADPYRPKIGYIARDTIPANEVRGITTNQPWSHGLEVLLNSNRFGVSLVNDGSGNFSVMHGGEEVASIKYHEQSPDHSYVLEVSTKKFPRITFGTNHVGRIAGQAGIKRTRHKSAELFAEQFLRIFSYHAPTSKADNEGVVISTLYKQPLVEKSA